MAHFVGLDVSVKETAVCVVDEVGEVVLEQKVPMKRRLLKWSASSFQKTTDIV